MIRRLLLVAGVLSALAGCGNASGAVLSRPNAPGQLRGTPSTTHPAATPAPVASAPAVAEVRPAAAPAGAGDVLAATAPATPTAPPAATPPRRNLVVGPHGLNTLVGVYTDCSGTSEVPHDIAAIDTCHTSAVLFIGHNHGVFTPLLSYVVGDVIVWYDQAGTVHHLRVVAVRDVSSSVFPPVLGTYEFQTCLYPTANSSLDRDLDAVEV